METRAPAVVAVVVTTGPAPFLATTLASLAAQDYEALSVLVLANGEGADGVAELVGAILPSAFVAVLAANEGFAAACNEAISMVQGATFWCFCHDDVTLAPDAIHQLVEEAFRSNAGIVSPKFVRPDDARVLLHVGLNADRFGATTERVEPGEVDQGQQDNARDVFVAPGGTTLVRCDLFETLGGFDGSIVAMGEDLDLCWRAQVAGSRIVLAHGAVVAHHELLANGDRQLSAPVTGHGSSSLPALTRRHRLATMLTCYGRLYALPTAALLVVLESAEVLVAALGRDRERIGAVVGSWRWCLGRLGTLRRRHRELSKVRGMDDRDVRRLQVAGASRLQTFGSKLVHEGMDVARGALVPATVAAMPKDEALDHTVGFGAAFSDDASFDELDDLGHRESGIHMRLFATLPTQVGLVVVVAILFAFGVRDLVAAHLPLIGRLAPLDSWWTTWRHYFAPWSSGGVGSGAPGMPGFGVLAFFGTFVFGRMGILPRAMLVLAIPVGAVGVWRLLRGVGSRRARLVGAVAFVCLALGPNLIAAGRVDVLTALALMPYLVRRLLVLSGVRPFAEGPPHVPTPLFDPWWRSTRTGQLVLLAALEAVIVALDPAAGVAVAVAAFGLFVGGIVVGDRSAGRVLGIALAAGIGAAVLVLPMTINTLDAGSSGLAVFGAPSGPWSLPGLGGLLRLAIGPIGESALSFVLPAAALLALVVGRGERLSVATRLAGMGIASIAASLLVARHLTGSFAPDVSTLLVPYALSVAALVGTGVAAFEQDVAASQFGWRQLLATLAVLGVLVGTFPFVSSVSTGRFDLPQRGYDTQFGAYLTAQRTGGTRTLWLGDPRSVPAASWPIEPGLAFATSTNGLPGGSSLFVPPSSGAASVLSDDVVLALRGDTVHLGRLLAAAGVYAIVVVTATAPALSGQQPISTPPPPGLLVALSHQVDLYAESEVGGVDLFINTASHGIVAIRRQPLSETASPGSFWGARYWRPVLDPATGTGTTRGGTLLGTLSPAGDFTVTVDGKVATRSPAFGWASSWRVGPGTATLSLAAPPFNAILAALVLVMWLAVLVAAVGVDRLERFAAWVRRRPRAPTGDHRLEGSTDDEPTDVEAAGFGAGTASLEGAS